MTRMRLTHNAHTVSSALLFWLAPLAAGAASAAITEIMYDLPGSDAGREWVELQNTGTETVSFAEWKFFEGDTNHGLSFFRGEATTSPGGFAIIADDPAKFLLDWPSFSGTLYGSSFSLGNSGEALALKFDGAVIDEVPYTSSSGAAGDGHSLQKTASGWQALPPTPAAAVTPAPAAFQTSTPSGVSSQTSGASAPPAAGVSSAGGAPSPAEQKIFVGMTAPANAVTGADVLFEARALGFKKEPLPQARYLWSFGDGASAEGARVLHVYHYPATYVVLVEASSGEWSATDRTEIAVATPELFIPRLKAGPDGFIELQNSGSDDLDLSRWFLKSGSQFFTFPKGTILPAQKTVPFAAAITRLSADQNDAALLYPNGTVAVRYAPTQTAPALSPPVLAAVPKPDAVVEAKPAKEPVSPPAPAVLQADTPKSAAPSSTELLAAVAETERGAALWMLGVAALVAVSVGGYLVMLRPSPPPSASDELRREAEQFDIVE